MCEFVTHTKIERKKKLQKKKCMQRKINEYCERDSAEARILQWDGASVQ